MGDELPPRSATTPPREGNLGIMSSTKYPKEGNLSGKAQGTVAASSVVF